MCCCRRPSTCAVRGQVCDRRWSLRATGACGRSFAVLLVLALFVASAQGACDAITDKFPSSSIQRVQDPKSFHLSWTPPNCNDVADRKSVV